VTESFSTFDEDPMRDRTRKGAAVPGFRPKADDVENKSAESANPVDRTEEVQPTSKSTFATAVEASQPTPDSTSREPLPEGIPEDLIEGVILAEDLEADGPISGKSTFDPPTGVLLMGEDKEQDFDLRGFETNNDPLLELRGIPDRIGDYVIERMIGSGGMGRVYLAKHQTMQRTVAIKTLPPEQSAQAWAVERFYEEVRAAARLLHPNIATAFDAGHSNGVHFLAMEYINGATLTSLVLAGGPMTVADAVSAIRGAARGLAHAHSAGVVHRDVKPSNLMRSSDGTVKVVDLGLALFAAPQHVISSRRDVNAKNSGRLVGTIAFMSPEQLENPDNVDARSDIYSLGATLYFLLTGRPPYDGEFLDQIRGIRHDPVPELFSVRPDVDLRLEHVFRRMMAKRPQERYASLVEVLADLASYDTSEVSVAWINALSLPNFANDTSTHRGGSTNGELAKVMGIDFGMFYATCAAAEPAGKVTVLTPADEPRTQHRLAVANGEPLIFGDAAAARREQQPGSVLHCIPLYVGQSKVDHLINGRQCPAEVLLAIQIRKLIDLCWSERTFPHAVALTVPSSYDQFHRQALIQAASIAGIRSVRLVDRSLAVLQSWRHDQTVRLESLTAEERIEEEEKAHRPHVVISITGMATEVVICRYRGSRIQQLSAVGQWHYGALQWQQKLVDMVAEACIQQHGFDPRVVLQTATRLQVACERALPKFLLLESVNISFQRAGRTFAIAVSRADWLDACEPFTTELMQMIDTALEAADIDANRVSHCFLVGILTRMSATRTRLATKFNADTEFTLIERTDIARGAAICVAGELPGRGDIPLPPQASTTHDLGLLVVDAKNRRRIRPIIPRGTAIPARTNRRIAAGAATLQVLTVVESSTWRETAWRSLGGHRIELDESDAFFEVTFEVNVDGRLIIRRRDPNTGSTSMLPTLPPPTLSVEEVQEWTEWVKELIPMVKRRVM
jgi:eukaryotic-like serine/threonine-protein kinase